MSFSVLTRDEAAKLARISSRQLDRLIATDAGPAVTRIGRRVLLPADSFEAWIKRGAPSPPPQRRYVAAEPATAADFGTVSEALEGVRTCQADIGERAAA
jgi:excisionase family DNA binding protein